MAPREFEDMPLVDDIDCSSNKIELDNLSTCSCPYRKILWALSGYKKLLSWVLNAITFLFNLIFTILNATGISAPKAIETQKSNEPPPVGHGDPQSWQTKCKSLSMRYRYLFEQGLWTNCILLVGPEERKFPAHRAIVAAASPVLENLLFNSDEVITYYIELPKVHPKPFKLVLEYIYTGNIRIPSCDMACELYREAHYLIMPQLEVIIKKYLLKNEKKETVIRVYEFAKEFDVKDVSEKCLELMSKKAGEILEDRSLETACAGTLEDMFALPDLNIESEMQLFLAAERWVQAKSYNTFLDCTDGIVDHEDPLNSSFGVKQEAKAMIRKAVQQIRFLAMEPEEFSKYDTSSLLSVSEISAISLNIMSTKTFMSMPHGFSTIKVRRSHDEIIESIKLIM